MLADLVEAEQWPGENERRAFSDVDSPTDLECIGLAWEIPERSAEWAAPPGVPGSSVP